MTNLTPDCGRCMRLDCPDIRCMDGYIHECICGDPCDCDLPDGKCGDCTTCNQIVDEEDGCNYEESVADSHMMAIRGY